MDLVCHKRPAAGKLPNPVLSLPYTGSTEEFPAAAQAKTGYLNKLERSFLCLPFNERVYFVTGTGPLWRFNN